LKHRQPSLIVPPTMLGQLVTCCHEDRFAFPTSEPKGEQIVLATNAAT
jgi:hypothetical protein